MSTRLPVKSVQPSNRQNLSNRQINWFLLTCYSPKDAERGLQRENMQRTAEGHQPYDIFVPYQFLRSHLPDALPTAKTQQTDGEHSNQIRAALHRYVFVRADEDELAASLRQPWNQVEHRLQFFHDRQHQRVSVPADEMDLFMQACADERLKFEVFPSVDEVESGEEVVLTATPFRGRTARIVSRQHTTKGTRLTVEVELFGSTVSLRMYDVHDEDLHYNTIDTRRQRSQDSKLVTQFLRTLLDILSRRINDKETPESRKADAASLDHIHHFRHHPITSDVLHRRFLAVMLICAHLRHDAFATQDLTAEVTRELDAINAQSESRAATDVRAYLHLALYLATGIPQYRAAAKQYVRDHAPHSEDLRRLLSLLCRREASRIIK